jgi:FtsP/CotA-like multicopper oxidase with cupredoxin domain
VWNTAKYGGEGNFWFPHVYMTNQNPNDPALTGANAMGRWDYALWFFPPYLGLLAHGSVTNPLCATAPTGLSCTTMPIVPGTPNPSLVPEGFMDTPLVNGTAYPVLKVQPQAYRFRVLNAANDRTWNLSLYQAGSNLPMWNANGTLADANAGEVPMVPAVQNAALPFPVDWTTASDGAGIPPDILDGRLSGVPNPNYLGPSWVQLGSEGGVLPAVTTLAPEPIGYQYNTRNIVVLNVTKHSLLLGPAERADVVVDFSQYAGKTLILYNDSGAPVPAHDPRNDYYTGDPDLTAQGGAPSTLPGYGPNIRTVMQIQVAATPVAPAFNVTALSTAVASLFTTTQPKPIVPEVAYGGTAANTYIKIADTSVAFTPINPAGPAVTEPLQPKAIQELFELNYGRMNATLGVELPFTNANNQTTVPLGYAEPVTEIMTPSDVGTPVGSLNDGTQIWKITHNGVDTHAIHFHCSTSNSSTAWAGTAPSVRRTRTSSAGRKPSG